MYMYVMVRIASHHAEQLQGFFFFCRDVIASQVSQHHSSTVAFHQLDEVGANLPSIGRES